METKMEFGRLIQDVRKEKGLEIRPLAEKVGVDASTISRIENLHTQATVYTAFRICDGLDISLDTLIERLIGRAFSPIKMESLFPLDAAFVVDLHHIDTFVNEFEKSRLDALNTLSSKMNRLHSAFQASEPDWFPDAYSVGEIERFIISTPLSLDYTLKYPPLKADLIFQIYAQEGAIIPNDVEVYARKSNRLPFSPRMSVDKIKLSELLEPLTVGGTTATNYETIVGMFWATSRFISEFDTSWRSLGVEDFVPKGRSFSLKPEGWKLKLAIFYVTLCRWELLASNDQYWWARL